MEVLKVPLDFITIGDRLRKLDPKRVKALAESIEAIGLQHPIHVWQESDNKIHLISGEHRLAAVQELGWDEIECHFTIVCSGTYFPLQPKIPSTEDKLQLNKALQSERSSVANAEFSDRTGFSHSQINVVFSRLTTPLSNCTVTDLAPAASRPWSHPQSERRRSRHAH